MIGQVAVAAGVAGAVLVGFCFYLDKQRRADPDYKMRVRERRTRMRQAKTKAEDEVSKRKELPPLGKFVKDNIDIGMTLLENGNIDHGIKLMANAFIISNNQHDQLFQHLQALLPPGLLYLVMMKVNDMKLIVPHQGFDD